MKDINNKIICGDVTKVLRKLSSDSIDCVVTSPPYWALRDYGLEPEVWDGDIACDHEWIGATKKVGTNFCIKCGAWKGSLGLEPTFDLFIKHLCDIFCEIKRVLKEGGTCWVNLGDTYSGGGNTNDRFQKQGRSKSVGEYKFNYKLNKLQEKCLCLIPFRFAVEMVNRGWILRNTIIWHKPNCMPSSIKDRFTVDFEYLFFFTKSKKYWFETQYEALKQSSIERLKHNFNYNKGDIASAVKTSGIKRFQERFLNNEVSGRNKRCVWSITTKPFREAHFATYPPDLCEVPIKSGCPQFICKKCGKAREKIYLGASDQAFNVRVRDVKERRIKYADRKASQYEIDNYHEGISHAGNGKKCIGYTDCGCNAGFLSGIVLDPFCGSGTTLAVAQKLGRSYLGIDLNPQYVDMSIKRIIKLLDERS